MRPPRCYRCDSTDLAPCSDELWASDEKIQATHECQKCRAKFRHTPPQIEAVPPPPAY